MKIKFTCKFNRKLTYNPLPLPLHYLKKIGDVHGIGRYNCVNLSRKICIQNNGNARSIRVVSTKKTKKMTTLEKIKALTNEIKTPLFFDGSKFEKIRNLESNFQGMIGGNQSEHFAFLKEQFAKLSSFGKTMPLLTQTDEIKDGTHTFEDDDALENFKKQQNRQLKRRLAQKKLNNFEINVENFIV